MSKVTALAIDRNVSVPSFIKAERVKEIESITQRVFGKTPTRIAFPGGKSRDVFVSEIDGTPYVFAKRSNKYDAKVEAKVLEVLSPTGLVPNFIARNGKWVVQECINGKRIPLLIDEASSNTDRLAYVIPALDSLVEIHQYAYQERLQKKAPRLGVVDNWIPHRIGYVDKVSKLLDISPPQLDRNQIARLYNLPQIDFVKWDSRLGNALLEDDRIVWFDWEDCGRRCRLDDMVCLLSDEWTNIDEDSVTQLIETYIPQFRRNMPEDKARQYFYIAGCLHIGFRLKLAIEYYARDNKWWSREKCLKGDKVGVTSSEVARLCKRLSNWSAEYDVLSPYGDWAKSVAAQLDLNFLPANTSLRKGRID